MPTALSLYYIRPDKGDFMWRPSCHRREFPSKWRGVMSARRFIIFWYINLKIALSLCNNAPPTWIIWEKNQFQINTLKMKTNQMHFKAKSLYFHVIYEILICSINKNVFLISQYYDVMNTFKIVALCIFDAIFFLNTS